MRKAGGIIAIIAGVFAVMAAIFTLLAGGFVSGLEQGSAALDGQAVVDTSNSQTILLFALGGFMFSFLVIVFGAVAMNAKSKKPGIFLIICSIAGALLGGTFVAVFMVLSLIGGILALFGEKKQLVESTA